MGKVSDKIKLGGLEEVLARAVEALEKSVELREVMVSTQESIIEFHGATEENQHELEGYQWRLASTKTSLALLETIATIAETVTSYEDDHGWLVSSGDAEARVFVRPDPERYLGLKYECEDNDPDEHLAQAVVDITAALLAKRMQKERDYV